MKFAISKKSMEGHWSIPSPFLSSLSFYQLSFSEIGSGTTQFSFTKLEVYSAEIVLPSDSSFVSTSTLSH